MKAIICDETARLGQQRWPEGLRAVILIGSLARDEATVVVNGDRATLLGDAEFILIFDERALLPSDADLAAIQRRLEQRLDRRGLAAEIMLAAGHPNYLRALRPSILAYELRHSGQVVAGDPSVLTLIPEFSRAEIPLEDAWRLLANRLVEQHASVEELLEGRPTLSPRAQYRTVKLYLDMATSFLVFVGAYAPTYGERAKALGLLAERPGTTSASWPFDIEHFSNDVAACTAWKLSASVAPDTPRVFWERAMDLAERLWRWELQRLQPECSVTDFADLLERWTRRQPLRERLLGWAHVVRRTDWRQRRSRWTHWTRQMLHASPRYAIYAAATETLFGVRASATTGSPGAEQRDDVCRRLPVPRRATAGTGEPVWSDLSADILSNYYAFCVNTRA